MEEKKPDLTPEQLEQGTQVLLKMHEDVHDLRNKMIDFAVELLQKWPKEEIEWMMKQAKEDEALYDDPLAPAVTQSVIEVLKLANEIRDDIKRGSESE